mmetsp:Transcript_6278/g.9119  ORF Transcript_6278/g.9119 Transcript_6278/m.9119 type:complete len:208 (+) Transcript_6278:121-744(+)|eukprot:CAMPEP_0184856964 /NCGR_PEP_ID=MMETSP0580-20130426/2136_1 /TAXON_ID=1118495 /ORGANISM="Dactyliosolen fragilissimus" /LENGTH=207 /DNA_ID=CAMNT_0027352293 /DNA_START=37 /DNA_END=660 /DNA_ORIENTATION=-
MRILSFIFVLLPNYVFTLQSSTLSRRSFLIVPAGIPFILEPAVANSAELNFSTSKSGIQWADAKVGTGPVPSMGSNVSIDYVLSTTGARYGSKIYSTADKGAPYRWSLGDGSTIAGLEEAIIGSGDSSDITAMRPGGIRRVIIPSKLAYYSLTALGGDNCKGVGPIPPVPEAFEEFQRFKNIYCNPNRAYQPDVVMDVKLYGRRSVD